MIEIQIDTGTNGDVMFHPSGDRVRGHFTPAKVNAPELGSLPRDFPGGVPGMIIQFDPATGTGRIIEPLLDPVHAVTRATIEKRLANSNAFGTTVDFGQAVKEYPKAHGPTWTGHMGRLVREGLAKVTKGKVPETDPPEMKVGFYSQPKADPRDDLIRQLTGLLAVNLPAEKRKELAALIGTGK